MFTCVQCLLIFSLRKITGFSDEDKILIKNLHDSKGYRGYGAKKVMKEFLEKGRSKSGLSCSVVSTVYHRQIQSIVQINVTSVFARGRVWRSEGHVVLGLQYNTIKFIE